MNLIPFIGPVTKLLEQILPNKKAADEAKLKMLEAMHKANAAEMNKKGDVVVAEAKGESWLQRNWRPMIMMLFAAVVANNYILAPYLGAFGIEVPVLDIAPQMWTLLTVGIGGYIAGRSGEKIAREFNKKKFYDSLREDMGSLSQDVVNSLEEALEKGNK